MTMSKTAAPTTGKKPTPVEQPPKVIKCRLPRNYEWNGNGYTIK